MQFNNLSVVEFNNIIKNILDSEEMLFNCTVVGEISSFKITNNIAYFAIKDDYAVLNCVCFNVEKEFKIGEKVKVVGRPNYYVKGGKLNFNVSYITSFGEGEIFKRFLLLKEKLREEGFFYNKKELPEDVLNIGVITSNTGAVIKDIISVTKRRNPNVNLYVYNSRVQGADAEKDIVKGLNFFNEFNVDVIIVARGGGSKEDLDVFNTENVARACFKCVKPVISAVGHETDYTLLDLVADIRAATPSVAAEIAVKQNKDKFLELKFRANKLNELMLRKCAKQKNNLIFKANKIINSANENLLKNRGILERYKYNYKYIINNNIIKQEKIFENLCYKIGVNNPKNIFKTGCGVVEKQGVKLSSVKNVKENDNLTINLKDGKILVKVIEVKDEI